MRLPASNVYLPSHTHTPRFNFLICCTAIQRTTNAPGAESDFLGGESTLLTKEFDVEGLTKHLKGSAFVSAGFSQGEASASRTLRPWKPEIPDASRAPKLGVLKSSSEGA